MAKVTVFAQILIEIETEIDDSLLELKVDKWNSIQHNDTVYFKQFTDEANISKIKEIIAEENNIEPYNIVSIIDNQTNSTLWEE